MTISREDQAIVWAIQRIPGAHPGLCRAFWVETKGEFDAVAVLSGFTHRNVDVSVAIAPTRLTARGVIILFNLVFNYAFGAIGAARTTGLIKLSNAPARAFAERLGFELEGVMREAFDDDDLCVYGFLRRDYEAHRWHRPSRK